MTEIAEKAGTSGQSSEEKRESVPANWEERKAASATTTEAMETGAPAAAAAEIIGKRARDEAEESGEEEAPTRTKVLIRGAEVETETPKKTDEKSGDPRQLQPGQGWRIEAARRRIFAALKKITEATNGKAGLSTGRPASGPRGAGGNPGGGKRHAYGGCPGKRGACVTGEIATDGGHSRERHERSWTRAGSGQGSQRERGHSHRRSSGKPSERRRARRKTREVRPRDRSTRRAQPRGQIPRWGLPGCTDQRGAASGARPMGRSPKGARR
jgi:hypothetical protein